MTPPRTKPILRWPGGKRRMLPRLLPLIPAHVCYCEPFAGGLAVLLAKPRSEVEVVNDLNGDLVALYRNIQYHLPELLREIEWFVSSRKNFVDFKAQPGLTEIQRAARFLLLNRTSFGGNMKSFAVARMRGGGATLDRVAVGDLLGAAHERLNKVVVENPPYERCLELYDSKDTFFFIDPPYLHAKINAYRGWTEAEMTALRRKLDRVKGRWVLTLDGSEFNRRLFKDCKIESVETVNGCVNSRTHSLRKFTEIIVTPA
ncbi:MAG TPA: DNA adenine methylase [Methylomirabilota bacterium]|nr:DNA adenine methylase [Methylomirabilota bacterium]